MSRRKFVSWNALPEVAGVRERSIVVGGLEDRQHHLADHRCRAVHVAEQVVPGGVRLDGEVHRHRAEEPAEAPRGRCRMPRTVWTDGLEHRIVGLARLEVGEEPVAEVGERRGAHLGRHVAPTLRGDLVDDVVGVAGERVQRMDVVLLDLGQHLGRPVVGGAVALVELPAQLVALVERDRPGRQQLGRRCRRSPALEPTTTSRASSAAVPRVLVDALRGELARRPAPSARRRRAGSTSR